MSEEIPEIVPVAETPAPTVPAPGPIEEVPVSTAPVEESPETPAPVEETPETPAPVEESSEVGAEVEALPEDVDALMALTLRVLPS